MFCLISLYSYCVWGWSCYLCPPPRAWGQAAPLWFGDSCLMWGVPSSRKASVMRQGMPLADQSLRAPMPPMSLSSRGTRASSFPVDTEARGLRACAEHWGSWLCQSLPREGYELQWPQGRRSVLGPTASSLVGCLGPLMGVPVGFRGQVCCVAPEVSQAGDERKGLSVLASRSLLGHS